MYKGEAPEWVDVSKVVVNHQADTVFCWQLGGYKPGFGQYFVPL